MRILSSRPRSGATSIRGAVCTLLAFASIAADAAEPTSQPATAPVLKIALDDWLEGVSLDKSEAALKAALVLQPRDDNLRFRLGAAQTARAVERVGQALYRHGFGNQQGAWLWMLTPPVPLRVPTNPQPSPLTYGELRRILSTWCDDLARAEATLAEIRDPNVAFAVRIGQIRLDMDGDGVATERERLISFDSGPSVARFDRADVAWWRAYCHLLMAFTEFYLAYDTAEFFDRTATLVFPAARVSQPLVEMTPSGGDFYE